MTKQVLVFEDIVNGGYVVMVVWATGDNISDIKHYDAFYRFESIDEVRTMKEALDGILKKWGDEGCMSV